MEYQDVAKKYKDIPGGIIETYHDHIDRYGFLPQEVIIEAAEIFGISVAEAYGVATFYSMFSVKPRGKNIIRVCQSAPCHMAGAAAVAEALQNHLGVKMGETTPDQAFTLEYTECVGQCQSTPVFMVNEEPYPGLAIEAIPEVLSIYQSDPDGKEDF